MPQKKYWIALITTAALLSMQLVPSRDALACGGLFCNANQPVNQVAERIFFAKNSDGTITAAIEILYAGPSEKFAWVLPIPAGEVKVGVSSKRAFDSVDSATNPSYRLNRTFSNCGNTATGTGGATAATPVTGAAGATSAAGGSGAATPPAVQVIDAGSVGPYDYVQISVDETLDDLAQVAVDWLEENDYDVSALGPEKLRSYLDEGMNLLAFRLTKGNDSGAIRPVMITYNGDKPSIPIKPTALAATEDMGIKVWVLGDSRAVPTTYLHLELNEAMINWFSPNATYNDIIVAAADEAGGQGFVTEFSGPSGAFAEGIFSGGEQNNWDKLNSGVFESMQQFLQTAASYFGSYEGYTDVLRDPEALPLREGATTEQFIACPSCYFQVDVAVANNAYPSTPYVAEEDSLNNMDPKQFLAALEEKVIEPLKATQRMFTENSSVTRFYTTLSPEEMTLDPEFDFNPELEDISNTHTAEQLQLCPADEYDWRITLPQGMVIDGYAGTWPISLETDLPVNLRVLQLSSSENTEMLEDNTKRVDDQLVKLGLGNASAAVARLSGEDSGSGNDRTDNDSDTETSIDEGDTTDEGDAGKQGSDDSAEAKSDDAAQAGSSSCTISRDQTPSTNLGGLLLLVGLALVRRRRLIPS